MHTDLSCTNAIRSVRACADRGDGEAEHRLLAGGVLGSVGPSVGRVDQAGFDPGDLAQPAPASCRWSGTVAVSSEPGEV
jgi:hypothetical protein